MPSDPSPQGKAALRTAVLAEGIRAGLRCLNHQVPHRFTALYRFGDHHLQNRYFYDRTSPTVETVEDVPLGVTYCVFMRTSRASLAITNATTDERFTEHPARQQVQAYCGVPLLDDQGKMFGSLCHFDFVPAAIAPDDLDLMNYMAGLLIDRERALSRRQPDGPVALTARLFT